MSDKKTELYWALGIGAAIGIIILWLAWDRKRAQLLFEKSNNENEILKNTNDQLKKDNLIAELRASDYEEQLKNLREIIDSSELIEDSIKTQLKSLINTYESIDPLVSNELTAAMALIEAQQPTKAAFSLAKIVENLLKEKYSNNSNFLQYTKTIGRNNPVFNDYIEYAKKNNDLNPEEYHFAKGLKELRNQEGHELGVKKETNFLQSAFFIGIGLIIRLSQTLKQ